jgi:hypothetical protein
MSSLERFLLRLDSGIWGAISRVVLGLVMLPVFRALPGGGGRIWITLALFLALLMALRVGPALLRRALPFSVEAREIWAERRNNAKQHDSYQWQKLFWIGLGLLPYAFIGDGFRHGELVATSICLIGGAAGLLLWRRSCAASAASRPVPLPTEKNLSMGAG